MRLWVVSRGSPLRSSSPPSHIQLGYSDPQIPLLKITCTKRSLASKRFSILVTKQRLATSFNQFGSPRDNPSCPQTLNAYPLAVPAFLLPTAYRPTAICCGIHPLDTQAPLPLYYPHRKGSSYHYHSYYCPKGSSYHLKRMTSLVVILSAIFVMQANAEQKITGAFGVKLGVLYQTCRR